MKSNTYHYKKGSNHLFSKSSHMVEPGKYYDEEVIILNIVINMYVLFIHWNNLHQMNGFGFN